MSYSRLGPSSGQELQPAGSEVGIRVEKKEGDACMSDNKP